LIKPFLSQVDGVRKVRVIGGKEKRILDRAQSEWLIAYGVTQEAVSQILSQTIITSNGYLANNRFYI
jgi:multidrug efflux pump subunit AcrB